MNDTTVAVHMAQDFAEPYKQFVDGMVTWQENNVAFLRALFESSMREAQRRTEADFALLQEFLERGEEQREALQRLAEKVMEAYWDPVLSSTGSHAAAVSHWTGAERPAPRAGTGAFPIPDYGRLTSAQIVEKLDGLTVDGLKKVRGYEMEHRNRRALLAQVEQRIQAAL